MGYVLSQLLWYPEPPCLRLILVQNSNLVTLIGLFQIILGMSRDRVVRY